MALERFYSEDFTPRRNYPPEIGANLPETWPITYEELRPHYQAAEALFRVRGQIDPLRARQLDPLLSPAPMNEASRELFSFLQQKGCHPYQMPAACEALPGCLSCQGFLCPRECKNDSSRICLRPALEQHGAQLLDECRVVRLEATRNKVTGVACVRGEEEGVLRADRVVLAAGALETPCLLLRSISSDWPQGLANDSGLVGRNFMRHFVDLYPVFLRSPEGLGSGAKQLAFNDFYLHDSGKLGTVQAFGALPPPAVLVAELEKSLHEGRAFWLAPLFRFARPILRGYLGKQFSRALILASVMEDLPDPENQVKPAKEGPGIVLCYRLSAFEKARIRSLRQKMADILKPYRCMLLKQAENTERLAHACGTCRFGLDPRTSVLDATNRAHGLSNLYVVDSSFFPSSGGINPALTIAANALRVADRIRG
jgi:choline dehydrogenase-like flavoprotein